MSLREAFIRRWLKAGARLVRLPDVDRRIRQEREQAEWERQRREIDELVRRLDPDRDRW